MRVAIILCSLVFASAAFVLQPAQAQVGDATLSGVVCTRWDGMDIHECFEPLPGAVVAVSGGPAGLEVVEKEDATDEDGSFAIDGLLPGEYTVSVTRTGFEGHGEELSISGDASLTVGLLGQEVDVAGQVIDGQGAAVPHAYLSMWGAHRGFEVQTDSEGRFSTRLMAGWYEVRIDSAAGALGGRFLVDGTDLELQLGQLKGQDAHIGGRIADQHGKPVEDALVVLEQHERSSNGSRSYQYSRNSTHTDADGRYSIGAYAGEASIQIQKENHASVYDWLRISTGANTFDGEMVRYPAKTATISGSVTDSAGQPLQYIHVRLQHPEYGLHECSSRNGSSGAAEPDIAFSSRRPYHEPGCAITIHSDGTFTGNVTPGYAILQVGYDRYAACDETRHADGSYERKCGPDYFSHRQTLELPANATTPVSVVLKQRPGPDAAISGYLVDQESKKAIPEAHISFSHQDSGSWGSASTDGDGSYKVRVRSGLHHVTVWAEGYLRWEGTVEVEPGGETPFDVPLKRGEAHHGGCCYAYDEVAVSHSPQGAAAPAGGRSTGQNAESFEDMGGGLGPYDPAQRAELLDEPAKKNAPIPVLAAIAGLALAGMARRRS